MAQPQTLNIKVTGDNTVNGNYIFNNTAENDDIIESTWFLEGTDDYDDYFVSIVAGYIKSTDRYDFIVLADSLGSEWFIYDSTSIDGAFLNPSEFSSGYAILNYIITEKNYNDSEKLFYLNNIDTVTSDNNADLKKLFFLGQLGIADNNYSAEDLELKWLQSQNANTNNLTDAWIRYLNLNGYSGDLYSMKKKFYDDNS